MAGGLGGYREVDEVTLREPLFNHEGLRLHDCIVSSAAYDGGNSSHTNRIRAGTLLGRITTTGPTTGLVVPLRRTTVDGDDESSSEGDGTTEVTLTNAATFKVGDVVSIGSETGLTITAIDYDSNVITVDSAIDVSDGDAVVATDGSQTFCGVLRHEVNVEIEETDTAINAAGVLVIAGNVNADMCIGDVDAVLADSNAIREGMKFFRSGVPIN